VAVTPPWKVVYGSLLLPLLLLCILYSLIIDDIDNDDN